MWAAKHDVIPYISRTFACIYFFGLGLPVLTTAVAAWFVVAKSLSTTRFAWAMLILTAVHLLWLSYGILAFYLTNQKFRM